MSKECSICKEDLIDEVFMTCGSKHSFCFSCLLKYVESSRKLSNCPYCRGGDKFIIIPDIKSNESNEFYSLYNFKKNINIMQKVLSVNITNTCLVSENLLLFYIKNKKQLIMFNFLILNEFLENDIYPFIKWKTTNYMEDIDIGIGIFGGITEEFMGDHIGNIRDIIGRYNGGENN